MDREARSGIYIAKLEFYLRTTYDLPQLCRAGGKVGTHYIFDMCGRLRGQIVGSVGLVTKYSGTQRMLIIVT